MLDTTKRTIAVLTAAACLGGGGWAIASSSNGSSGSSDTSTATATDATIASGAAAYGTMPGSPSQQTEVTGAAAEKIRAAVLAKEPGATILRIEQDAQGYHAHITKADGTPATVLLNAQFAVTAVEAGRGPGAGAPDGMGRGGPGGRDCPQGAGGGGGAGEAPVPSYGGSVAPAAPAQTPAAGSGTTEL